MFDNSPREIKFKIGKKEYDKKVNEFYNLLVKSVDSYTNTAIIFQQMFWDGMLFNQFTDEDAAIEIQEKCSLSKWDQKKLLKHIHKLSLLDELEYKLYSPENADIDYEYMCFAKALVFYLNKLESIRDYSITNASTITDVINDKMLPAENLNYYKTFIDENSNKLYNGLHKDYLERSNKMGKEKFTNLEKNEFARLLSTDDKGNDYLYLTPRIEFHDFHEAKAIRTIAMKLLNGSYYDILFHFGTGQEKKIMSEVLAIQKYVAFLNTQLPAEKVSDTDTQLASVGKTKKLYKNSQSFFLTDKGNTSLNMKLLAANMYDKNIIHKIDAKDFAKIFNGDTDVKINFVGEEKGDGLINLLWFMFFMVEDLKLVKKGRKFRLHLTNCFLLNGEPISNDDDNLNTISSMLSIIRKGYKNKKFERLIAKHNEKLSEKDKFINSLYDSIDFAMVD